MVGRVLPLVLALAAALPAAAQDMIRPAELPPSGYAGQQYVDSRGCLFLRAGGPGKVLWVPRVTRQGQPLCNLPPSGHRVPTAEEGAAAPVPEAPAAPAAWYVAVGSFGVAANADKAAARLKRLGQPVARGRLEGDSGLETVFAGPFATSETAARVRADLAGAGFPDAVVIGP